MKISKRLQVFIEDQFEKMKKNAEELKNERTEKKPIFNKAKVKRFRKKEKLLKNLEELKDQLGHDAEDEIKSLCARVHSQNEISKRKEGSVAQNPLKGKATHDFNNFLVHKI